MPHVIRCERPITKDPLIPSMEIVQVVKMVTCQFEDLNSRAKIVRITISINFHC